MYIHFCLTEIPKLEVVKEEITITLNAKIIKNHLFSLELLNGISFCLEFIPEIKDKNKIINNIKLSIDDKKDKKL